MYTNEIARKVTLGKATSIILILILFTIVGIATSIHLSKTGNKPEAKEEVF